MSDTTKPSSWRGETETKGQRKRRKRRVSRARARGGYRHEQAHRTPLYDPPSLHHDGLYPWERPAPEPDGRCQAMTRKGTRCKNSTDTLTCKTHTNTEEV